MLNGEMKSLNTNAIKSCKKSLYCSVYFKIHEDENQKLINVIPVVAIIHNGCYQLSMKPIRIDGLTYSASHGRDLQKKYSEPEINTFTNTNICPERE